MKNNPLKDISGTPIRHQYFNFPIYIVLFVLLVAFSIITFVPLFEGNFNFSKWMESAFSCVFMALVFIIPFLVLSVFNRFFFGKIVCVLNEEGINYQDGLIPWNDISCIKYNMTYFGKAYFQRASIDVICGETLIQIKSVPLYSLSVAKKFHTDIKIKMDKMLWVIIAILIVASILTALDFE